MVSFPEGAAMIQPQHQHSTYEGFIGEIRYLTRMITDRFILDRMKDYPHLTNNGWDNNQKYAFDVSDVDGIRMCILWIAENTRKTKTIRRKYGSYFFKHAVERSYSSEGNYHPYVSNGQFIAAAIIQTYRFEVYDRLNCDFNMAMPRDMQRQVRGY